MYAAHTTSRGRVNIGWLFQS